MDPDDGLWAAELRDGNIWVTHSDPELGEEEFDFGVAVELFSCDPEPTGPTGEPSGPTGDDPTGPTGQPGGSDPTDQTPILFLAGLVTAGIVAYPIFKATLD